MSIALVSSTISLVAGCFLDGFGAPCFIERGCRGPSARPLKRFHASWESIELQEDGIEDE